MFACSRTHAQAAEQGYPDAYFYLGMMSLRGLGVRRKSVQRAFSYLSLAAHVGHVQVCGVARRSAACSTALRVRALA